MKVIQTSKIMENKISKMMKFGMRKKMLDQRKALGLSRTIPTQ